MIEFATVYGRFYRNARPVSGTAIFTPRYRTLPVNGVVYTFGPIIAPVIDGVLSDNGTPGVTIPAGPFGITWRVRVLPLGYSNVLQSFPGDIISLGE